MRNPNTIFLGRSTVRLSSVCCSCMLRRQEEVRMRGSLAPWRREDEAHVAFSINVPTQKFLLLLPFQIFFFFFQPRREREENESTISDVAFLFVFFFPPSYVISSFPSIATKITKLCCCPISFFFSAASRRVLLQGVDSYSIMCWLKIKNKNKNRWVGLDEFSFRFFHAPKPGNVLMLVLLAHKPHQTTGCTGKWRLSLCGTFLNYSRRRGSTRGGGGAMKKRTGTFALRLLFQRFQFSSTNQRWHAFSSAALRQFHFPPFFSLLFMWWTCTQKGKLVEPFSSCCEYVIISNARRLDAAEREVIFVRRRSSSIWNPPSKKRERERLAAHARK